MSMRRVLPSVFVCLVLSLAVPGSASAQWYLAGYIGGNHTLDATVSIRVPAQNLAVDFRDVQFAAQPNYPRRYYGLRIGKMFGAARRYGIELEHIHMKALADTSQSYDVTVLPGSALPPGGAQPMSNIVSEYQMTHGLNLVFVNLVMRRQMGGSQRFSLMLRGGAGPVFPHAESTVFEKSEHQYEWDGFGVQGAAGIAIQLPYRLSVITEYKLTYARPTISVADDGSGWMHTLTHHVVVGMAVNITK